jgi:hypothetical protein
MPETMTTIYKDKIMPETMITINKDEIIVLSFSYYT